MLDCLINNFTIFLIFFLSKESAKPNCEVVDLEDGSGALVALVNIRAGDWLSVGYSSDEGEEED